VVAEPACFFGCIDEEATIPGFLAQSGGAFGGDFQQKIVSENVPLSQSAARGMARPARTKRTSCPIRAQNRLAKSRRGFKDDMAPSQGALHIVNQSYTGNQ
jgi:hypothetical protein